MHPEESLAASGSIHKHLVVSVSFIFVELCPSEIRHIINFFLFFS